MKTSFRRKRSKIKVFKQKLLPVNQLSLGNLSKVNTKNKNPGVYTARLAWTALKLLP